MNRRQFLALTAGAAVATGGSLAYRRFSDDMAVAHERLSGRSEIFQSRFGTMEYAVAGNGPPLLVVHGMGGGFDQALDWIPPRASGGRKVVAPSRFGYLRTDFPEDPSLENQADAFVDLIDHLKIERLPVIGISAGAQSAIQFAIRHSRRCSALVCLVPATYAPDRARPQVPIWAPQLVADFSLLTEVFYWLGCTLAQDRMIGSALATDPALLDQVSAREAARARSILRNVMPIRERARGIANDARQAGWPSPLPLSQVNVPTLALSLADDRFQTFAAARQIAAQVPKARLVSYPKGGHIWLGLNDTVLETVDLFLEATAGSKN